MARNIDGKDPLQYVNSPSSLTILSKASVIFL